MFAEHETVRLRRPIVEHGLATGAVGAVLQVHAKDHIYSVEFVDRDGVTIALLELPEADLERVTATKVACPRCGQDWLRHARLVHLEVDAIFCPDCEALWRTVAEVGPSSFEDYGTFMIRHGRTEPDDRGEIALGAPLEVHASLRTTPR